MEPFWGGLPFRVLKGWAALLCVVGYGETGTKLGRNWETGGKLGRNWETGGKLGTETEETGTETGDRREVSPILKISNPSNNMRNVPSVPDSTGFYGFQMIHSGTVLN